MKNIEKKLIYEEWRALKRRNDIADDLIKDTDIREVIAKIVESVLRNLKVKL